MIHCQPSCGRKVDAVWRRDRLDADRKHHRIADKRTFLVKYVTKSNHDTHDEAIVDAFAMFPSLDQMLDFASQVIARWSDRGKA